MRMWMVPTYTMCRQHLLGEHVELHMFLGSMMKGVSMKGYVDNGLFEPNLIYQRHTSLVQEMEDRGYAHASPLDPRKVFELVRNLPTAYQAATVDRDASLTELHRRCPVCRLIHKEHRTKIGL